MYQKELVACLQAAKMARTKIMEVYNRPFEVEIKSDDSPVTEADKEADRIIKEYLSKEFPSYAFLTEESCDDLSRRENDYLFIVDPVDGTKDFVAKDNEFTTNIALAYQGEVVLGVVSIPATKEIYYAVKGQGAYYLQDGENPHLIHVNDKVNDLTILTSRFHVTAKENEIIEQNKEKISKVRRCGSSIKACLIARGEGEVSFRLGSGTKEWDTAASQIIVEEAGGIFAKPDLSKITYNRLDVYNREGFVVLNRKENISLMK
ncbi:MAG: 3'(2'),5'-bisphosphate nucleotidase CysQ [Bacilli bacterium]